MGKVKSKRGVLILLDPDQFDKLKDSADQAHLKPTVRARQLLLDALGAT